MAEEGGTNSGRTAVIGFYLAIMLGLVVLACLIVFVKYASWRTILGVSMGIILMQLLANHADHEIIDTRFHGSVDR